MEIYVALPTRKFVSLEEKPSNTIKHVKNKLQAKEGIPSDQQLLMINTGQKCKELKDDCILSDCSNSILLRLILKLKYFKVYVRESDGCEEVLQVKEFNTVGYIKQNVFKYAPPDSKQLFFDNEELEDKHTMNDYDIQNESILTIHLTNDKIQCFMKALTGKTVTLDVYSWDTIKKLKTKIADKEGIPPYYQNLVSDRKIWEDDSRTFSDYGYKRGDVIKLVLQLRGDVKRDGNKIIFVRLLTGKSILLHVKGSDTIQQLKYYIQMQENIPQDQQRLLLNRKELIDEKRLYDYYGYGVNIPDGSTINLLIIRKGGIQIDIVIARKSITMKVDYSDTIEK